MAVMVVPGPTDQAEEADKDPRRQNELTAGFTGSVVGIQLEVAGMYTGTLINDLMAAVERVGQRAEERRMEEELHEIFTMQMPEGDRAYMGAA